MSDRRTVNGNNPTGVVVPADRRRGPEQQVLGIMLRDRLAIDEVRRILPREELFGLHHHQVIYRTIVDLHADGKPIDLVFLAEELKRRKQIEEVGGYAYLAEIHEGAGTSSMVEQYCRVVLDHSLLCGLGHVAVELRRDAADPFGPATEIISEYGRRLDKLGECAVVNEPVTLQQALDEQVAQIDARTKRSEHSGLPTGYMDLDRIIVGLQPSELVIIGARPSVGKTALGTNIVRNLCSGGASVFFASLEQSRNEITERLLACEGMVDSYRMRTGQIDADDTKRLIAAQGEMIRWKMFIDDAPMQGVVQIAANARRLKRRHGLDAVFIDYLQLVEPDNKREDRYQQVGAISRRLKQLARDLKIPVIAACQVGRDADDNEPPKLRHLRESGNIEQDTDVCLLLCRLETNDAAGTEKIGVEVAKNRNGRRGKFPLVYQKKFTRFESCVIE